MTKDVEEVLELLKDNDSYIQRKGRVNETEVYEFCVRDNDLNPHQAVSFLAHFGDIPVSIVIPEDSELKKELKEEGLDSLVESVVSLEEYGNVPTAQTVVLAGKVLIEEILDRDKPERIIMLNKIQPFGSDRPVSVIDYNGQEELVKDFVTLSGKLSKMEPLNHSSLMALIAGYKDGSSPDGVSEKILRQIEEALSKEEREELRRDLNAFADLFERLGILEFKLNTLDYERYMAFRAIASRLEGDAGQSDGERLASLEREFARRKGKYGVYYRTLSKELPFEEKDQNESFLDNYADYPSEASEALEVVKGSPEIEKLQNDKIHFKRFHDLVSEILIPEILGNLGSYPNLSNTDKLTCFIEDLYDNKDILIYQTTEETC